MSFNTFVAVLVAVLTAIIVSPFVIYFTAKHLARRRWLSESWNAVVDDVAELVLPAQRSLVGIAVQACRPRADCPQDAD